MSTENNNFSNGLWLVGLGPGNIDLITIGAAKAIENCNHVFIEGYTANLQNEDLLVMQERYGEWKTLMRKEIEEPDKLLAIASEESVALLIIGDVLQATTHIDLILRCQKLKIPVNLIPGISITTLIGEIGLQAYRFGRQTTIPYIYKSYLPTSPLEVILMNKKNNLHTLVLFDLDPTGMGEEKPQPMTPSIAIDTLNSMSKKLNSSGDDMDEDVMSWKGILCSNLGTKNSQIMYSSLERLSMVDLKGMHCMIFPSKLHEIELLALSRWEVK